MYVWNYGHANQTVRWGGRGVGDLENMQATFWDINCSVSRQIAQSQDKLHNLEIAQFRYSILRLCMVLEITANYKECAAQFQDCTNY